MIFIGEYAILLAYHGILSTKGEVMRDIHTHILPGIDDGSRDLYDSMEMAAMAADGGTTVMVATPHCNIPGVYDNYFGKEYIELFRSATEVLQLLSALEDTLSSAILSKGKRNGQDSYFFERKTSLTQPLLKSPLPYC